MLIIYVFLFFFFLTKQLFKMRWTPRGLRLLNFCITRGMY